MAGSARRQGLRDHRGRERDRRRDGAAVRRGGRPRRRSGPRRGRRGRAGPAGRRRRRGLRSGRCTRKAAEEMGRIDVLFNNAGISPDDDVSVLDTSLEAWQRVQDVNLKSVFLCCKHGIPHLLDGRRRLGDQHRVVRRGDGRRHLADLLHRLEGRRARALARAGGGVRQARRPRQRPLPRPGQHAAAAGAVRRRTPRRRRAGSSTCRWAASPRPARSPRAPSSWRATRAPT